MLLCSFHLGPPQNVDDFPKHDIFIGEVTATYYNEEVLTDGKVDITKVDPILFVMSDKSYYKVGEKIAKAWDIGNELVVKKV